MDYMCVCESVCVSVDVRSPEEKKTASSRIPGEKKQLVVFGRKIMVKTAFGYRFFACRVIRDF